MSTLVESSDLRSLLEPRTIAVIGASPRLNAAGSRPGRYLAAAGFSGSVFQINPRLAGSDGYIGKLSDLPHAAVDLAMVMLGGDAGGQALLDCIAAGVRAVVLASAAISTPGSPDGSAVLAAAHDAGVRVLGPNSLGLVNARDGAYATFASLNTEKFADASRRSLAIVTQSGAIASYFVAILESVGLGCGFWVSTGNESDVDIIATLDYVAERNDIELVLVYVEGIEDAAGFLATLRKAKASGKRVGVIKSGRTPAGAAAVASHTAAIAGDYAAFESLVQQGGAMALQNFTEMLAFAQLGNAKRYDEGLIMVTVSGGVAALVADAASDGGLKLSAFDEDTRQRLTEVVPVANPVNPLDVTGNLSSHPELIHDIVAAIGETPWSQALFFAGPALVEQRYGQPIVEAAVALAQSTGKQVILSGADLDYVHEFLNGSDVPLVADPILAVSMLSRLRELTARRDPEPPDDVPGPVPWRAVELISRPGTVFSEFDAKRVLDRAGIQVPRFMPVASAADVIAFEAGLPAVLKVESAEVTHKSDLGLVAIVRSADEAEAGFRRISASADRADLSNWGVVAEEFVQGGVEMLVDVRRDPVFGVVLTVGAGGIYAEADRDFFVWLGAISRERFREKLAGLRCWPRLSGGRGNPPADIEALYNVAAVLIRLAEAAESIAEIELNPVLVRQEEGGAIALDAVIRMERHPA